MVKASNNRGEIGAEENILRMTNYTEKTVLEGLNSAMDKDNNRIVSMDEKRFVLDAVGFSDIIDSSVNISLESNIKKPYRQGNTIYISTSDARKIIRETEE